MHTPTNMINEINESIVHTDSLGVKYMQQTHTINQSVYTHNQSTRTQSQYILGEESCYVLSGCVQACMCVCVIQYHVSKHCSGADPDTQ